MDPLDFRRSQCVAAKPCNTNESGSHSESSPDPVWEEKTKTTLAVRDHLQLLDTIHSPMPCGPPNIGSLHHGSLLL